MPDQVEFKISESLIRPIIEARMAARMRMQSEAAMIQLTLWAQPLMTMYSQYGTTSVKEWLQKEKERMESHGRTAEIMQNSQKEVALFVDKVS